MDELGMSIEEQAVSATFARDGTMPIAISNVYPSSQDGTKPEFLLSGTPRSDGTPL